MSDANLFELAYIRETTEGETPATPAMTKVRLTDENLNFNVTSEESQEIESGGNVVDTAQVSGEVSGNINFELSFAAFEDFFMSVLHSDGFSTAVNISDTDIAADNTGSSFTSSTTDFTANNISVGQMLKVGGFADSGNNGYFRVTSIAANTLGVSPAPASDEAAGPTVTMEGSMLANATDIISFSTEKRFTDANAGAGEFFLDKGMRGSSLQLSLASASRITGQIGLFGRGRTASGTTTADSVSNAPQNQIMNATSNVALLREADADLTDPNWVSSLTFNVDAGAEARRAVGNFSPIGVRTNKRRVTIDLTTYFGDRTLYEKLLNDTQTSLSFATEDADGNVYVFDIPKMEAQSGEVVAEGVDSDVMANMSFMGIKDSNLGATVALNKFAAP